MNETVDHAAVSIKFRNQGIKESPILKFVLSECRIGDEVGKLNQTGRLGVHEQGYFGQIPEASPPASVDPEMPGQGLQWPFMP
jgi:hypothetical protein